MSKLDDAYNKAMKAIGDAKLPKEVHGLPADGDYVGTCQACFNQYVVKQFKSSESRAGGEDMLKPMPKGKLVVVLHGYERPGHGFVEGECPGRGHEPFEVAKDVTELFRKRLVKRIAETEDFLGRLKSGQVKQLTIQVTDKSKTYSGSHRVWGKRPTKWITIEPGWRSDEIDYVDFDYHVKLKIRETSAHLDGLRGDLRFLDMMLSNWKYDPQALTNTKGRRIGIRAADQQQAQEARTKKKAEVEKRKAEKAANLARRDEKALSDIVIYRRAIASALDDPNTGSVLKKVNGPFYPQTMSAFDHILSWLERDKLLDFVRGTQELEAAYEKRISWNRNPTSVRSDLRDIYKTLREYAARGGVKLKATPT